MENWKLFFQSYRIVDVKGDDDLLFQVGTTVGGKPISKIQHDTIIASIVDGLDLNLKDNVLDLCCGNGIITYDLSSKVNSIMGIDASLPYIENAIKFKSNKNTSYINEDVLNFEKIVKTEIDKVVLYAALAYFSEDEFAKILNSLKILGIKKIFIGSILDKNKKFNYFNTFGRRVRYFFNYFILKKDFGLGNWWSKKQIELLAKQYSFNCKFIEQNSELHTAHYRFDCVLYS